MIAETELKHKRVEVGESQLSESGLNEQFLESLKERYFMYPHFLDGLATGRYKNLPQSEIDRIVQENFFSFKPLIQLNKKQEDLLRQQVTEWLSRIINMNKYESLSGQVFYKEDEYFGATLYIDGTEKELIEEGRLDPAKLKVLTPEEKITLLSNPANWRKFRLREKCSEGGLVHYGNRNLIGKYDEYFGSAESFKDLVAKLRASTGQEKLIVLDIGCGMGKALQDMKEIDPNLETHGITQEQEPAMFDADQYHYISAERFPADFRNKFHWINSQVAFRYFTFQNIALRNVLLSLARGGLARLGFSYEAKHDSDATRAYLKKLVPESENYYEAMGVLVSQEMAKLDELQRMGKIKYETNKDFKAMGNQGYLGIEKLEEFDDEDLAIIETNNYGQ